MSHHDNTTAHADSRDALTQYKRLSPSVLARRLATALACGTMAAVYFVAPPMARANFEGKEKCTFTQGYWKNHPDAWTLKEVKLGKKIYSNAEALSIFNQPVSGNGLVSLSHQLIAAKLNVAGSDGNPCIEPDIAAADKLIGHLVVPPVGSGYLDTSLTSALNDRLDAFNNGRVCALPCYQPPTNILVVKTVYPEKVEAGTTFTYTITVLNDSQCEANDVVLTDTLPSCIVFESAYPAPVDPMSNPLKWNLELLKAGESKMVEVVARATCDSGACLNTATVSTSNKETNYDDNVDTAEVIIEDTTAPYIKCPADKVIDCAYPCITLECLGKATAKDLCGVASLDYQDTFEGDCGPTGVIKRVWTAKDPSGNKSECTQLITIVDETKPVLSGQGPDETIECPNKPVFTPPTAKDNCDPDPVISFQDKVIVGECPGTYAVTRTWVATDACGNVSDPVSQSIKVVDTTAPKITCPADINAVVTEGTCVKVYYSAKAVDDCDPYPVITYDPPSGTCFECETVNTVTATATDCSGNKSSCTFKVTVAKCVAPGCSLTQGYWKNHPDAWPVSSLKLGNVTYKKPDLLKILKTEVSGNGLISLSHQLIAAKLNVAAGADPSCIQSTIDAADKLIGNLVVPPIGKGYLNTSTTSAFNDKLDDYNNGRLCVPHCDSKEAKPVSYRY